MGIRVSSLKNRKSIESILLVCAIVASTIVIVLPMNSPEVSAVTHLMTTSDEDNDPLYDLDPTVGVVLWNVSEDHILTMDYIVEPGFMLIIPALNYETGIPPTEYEISMGPGVRIIVLADGTLLTGSDGNPLTKTAFVNSGLGSWDGIYFEPGSSGVINDSLFLNTLNGVNFQSGSEILAPGITETRFQGWDVSALRLEGATGATNVHTNVMFDNSAKNMGTGLYVGDGNVNITGATFMAHGNGLYNLQVKNSTVNVAQSWFSDLSNPGNSIFVEDNPAPNSTTIDTCSFQDAVAGNWYLRADGAEILVDNCTFDQAGGELTAVANENATGVAGNIYLINPNPSGVFNNDTLNATGSSSVSLLWYLDVYVDDPDGNPIVGAPVWVVDRFDIPAIPPTKQTDGTGWATWFSIRELVQYDVTRIAFNPFNVSAENNSIFGYTDPEPSISTTGSVPVTVPFSKVPNILPNVTFISTPGGIQSGAISIFYIVTDPNPGDDGNLSVDVYFNHSTLGGWLPATMHITSQSTSGLNNNTIYTFIWDSTDSKDMLNMYDTQVFIKIIPKDKSGGEGTEAITFNFTVDNVPPQLTGGPTTTPTDTTCLIEWTMNEPAYATVNYGLSVNEDAGDITDSASDPAFSTSQAVTLTGLQPGRKYTFALESADGGGNTYTSPGFFFFDTEVHIQLFTGWNFISLPPTLGSNDIATVFASISGDYDIIRFYDALDPADPWKNYIPGKPFGNDLSLVYPEMGVMVHMTTDTVMVPTTHSVPWGLLPEDKNPTTSPPLVEGWNMVGYGSVANRPVASVMGGITYDIIQTYNAASVQWESWDGTSGNLVNVEMGRGYWIHVPFGIQFWDIDYHD